MVQRIECKTREKQCKWEEITREELPDTMPSCRLNGDQ